MSPDLPGLDHAVQMRSCIFDVEVFVLSSAAFGREYATSMDPFKIPIGKLVVSLGIFGTLVVDAQIPFAVFSKADSAEKFIFLFGRWPVFAPRIPFVEYKLTFVDERLGMAERPSVKYHGHNGSPFKLGMSPSPCREESAACAPRRS